MLEFYFKYPRVLRRLRNGGLGDEMDRIAADPWEKGYKRGSAKIYLIPMPSDQNLCAQSRSPMDMMVHG
jgi:hypothetical protein